MITPTHLRRLRSSSGLSLLQVLVAVAIAFLIGTLVLQMLFQMKKVEMFMSMTADVTDMEMQIQRLLLSPRGCINSLHESPQYTAKGLHYTALLSNPPPTLPGIYAEMIDYTPGAQNAPVFGINQTYANGKLTFDSIQLVPNKPGDPPTDLRADVVRTIYLEFHLRKNMGENGMLAGDHFVRRMPIRVQFDHEGYVKGCSALNEADNLKSICEETFRGRFDQDAHVCRLDTSPLINQAICDVFGMLPNDNGRGCH